MQTMAYIYEWVTLSWNSNTATMATLHCNSLPLNKTCYLRRTTSYPVFSSTHFISTLSNSISTSSRALRTSTFRSVCVLHGQCSPLLCSLRFKLSNQRNVVCSFSGGVVLFLLLCQRRIQLGLVFLQLVMSSNWLI